MEKVAEAMAKGISYDWKKLLRGVFYLKKMLKITNHLRT